MEISRLSKIFKTFAETECAGSSKLYKHLSLKIAEDAELLELSSFAKEGQPIPNLLLGAVHYLLLKGNEQKLSQFYPSIVEKPKAFQDSFPYFKDFCLTYRDQITSILKEKMVQTNEVRRCGYLYPIFSYVYGKVKKPLALIEIGTSAGFQLLWDKYSYSYNSDEVYGDIESNIHIKSENIGKNIPTLSKASPPVTDRFGLDLHINDLSNVEDSLWLNALIWPEHKERRFLFEQALVCLMNYKDELDLIEGDGVELLQRLPGQIPNDSIICIYHTHVANQMPVDVKNRLIDNVKNIAKERDVFHIYNNVWDKDLHLDYFINGAEYNEIIAETDGHGRWFKWMF
ncbi:DUF2332 domain-containing protein [Lederbergia citrea]|uniref:DUF2332 domain-containing protein n=1 Tax=Lederbergia citrea TaxID=2833581 RepID=UPI001BCA42BC|nr:DUF2332 domain-containing protein [Lederbergia citrea]MBS4176921.1 DUF2332 domain-containing protein [Lederbergia citrea]